jgi:hypothetical protein
MNQYVNNLNCPDGRHLTNPVSPHDHPILDLHLYPSRQAVSHQLPATHRQLALDHKYDPVIQPLCPLLPENHPLVSWLPFLILHSRLRIEQRRYEPSPPKRGSRIHLHRHTRMPMTVVVSSIPAILIRALVWEGYYEREIVGRRIIHLSRQFDLRRVHGPRTCVGTQKFDNLSIRIPPSHSHEPRSPRQADGQDWVIYFMSWKMTSHMTNRNLQPLLPLKHRMSRRRQSIPSQDIDRGPLTLLQTRLSPLPVSTRLIQSAQPR